MAQHLVTWVQEALGSIYHLGNWKRLSSLQTNGAVYSNRLCLLTCDLHIWVQDLRLICYHITTQYHHPEDHKLILHISFNTINEGFIASCLTEQLPFRRSKNLPMGRWWSFWTIIVSSVVVCSFISDNPD